MLDDYSRDLLRNGIIELKAGNPASARRYLDRCVYMSTDPQVMAEAWYWLSQVTDDSHGKRQALENCLANDLYHARARRALAILDGKLRPEEIIDPNAPVPAAGLQGSQTQRFTCPRCGGRMVYSPDGHSLLCEYCRQHQRLGANMPSAPEDDFILAMATRRGQSQPLREQIRRCQGCGAEFIRAATDLSFTCPYCASAQVVAVESSGDLVAPHGILPHAFDQRRAGEILAGWLREQELDCPIPPGPRGLYLPAWTFALAGGIDYVGETLADENDSLRGRPPRTVQVRDRYPVMLNESVAASRRPSAAFVRLIPGFDLRGLQTYDARYLAAWPAELYDVPLAEASLEARSQAYAGLQRDLPAELAPMHVLSTSSANLVIESFRLDLLPVWTSDIRVSEHGGMVLINGQTGEVAGEGVRPRSTSKPRLLEWLGDLLNE